MSVRVSTSPMLAALCLPLFVSFGCSRITHSSDFETREPEPDTRACVECKDVPELRHVPCPPEREPDGEQLVHYFALRAMDFGARASGWTANYKVGFDRDCSDRPDGRPVVCVPRSPDAHWEHLSDGVDNAFATQVLYPLIQYTTFSPQVFVNQSLERGEGGILLIVDHWNGRANDKQVGVRLVPSKQVRLSDGSTKPRWDGHDEWIAYADSWDPDYPGQNVPDTENKSSSGYVKDGMLVWDARDIPAFRVTLRAGDAVIQVQLASVVFAGRITASQKPRVVYDAVLSGLWSSFYASRSVPNLAQAFAGCDMCRAQKLGALLDEAIANAPDMVLPTSTNETACDALSFAVLGNYEEVGGVVDIEFPGNIPRSCDGVAPCEKTE